MAKSGKKNSAFLSGMRGGEKSKGVEESKTSAPDAATGGEAVQGPSKEIGDSAGVDLPAYTSGMRGIEKPKQKSGNAATLSSEDPDGGPAKHIAPNKQAPGTVVGDPEGVVGEGHDHIPMSMSEGQKRSDASAAYKMAKPGAGMSLESPIVNDVPQLDEDDTHINVKIPKSSLGKRHRDPLSR